ncbi:hypothetical protein D5086_029880 [Populus alba]|uniref:Uncharacterized protein n=1 Tax=Populus alba TaxID=43335 RepID=A0ACC4AMQ8_POPAL
MIVNSLSLSLSALLGNPPVTLPTTSSSFTVRSHGIAGSYLVRPSLILSSFLNFITVGLLGTTLLGTNFKAADQLSSNRQTDKLSIHLEKRA